ncbi:MAG: polymer-forming cytoskeletal protein, partial [Myxococcota bacterium]
MAKKKPWLETPQEFGEWDTSVTDGSVGPPPPADVADDAVDDPDQVGVEAAPEPTLPDPTPTPVPVLDVDEIESTNRPDVTAEVELPTGETILGPTIVVRGRMRSSEDLVVHGRIEAAVHSTRDLRLESTGVVNADLDVRAVWVSGIVVGDIRATDRVELGPQARVIGDIRTPRLIIHDGAKFRGTIEMDGLQALEIVRPSRPTPAPPPPAPEPPRVVPNAPT